MKLYPHSLYTMHVPEQPTEEQAVALMMAVRLFSSDELVEGEHLNWSNGPLQLDWYPIRPGMVRGRVRFTHRWGRQKVPVRDDGDGGLFAFDQRDYVGSIDYKTGGVLLPPTDSSTWSYMFNSGEPIKGTQEDFQLIEFHLVTEPLRMWRP